MQRAMRQYRNYILTFILLFIGVPMLFFGVPGFFDGQMSVEGRVVGFVGDEEIYESALRNNLDAAASRFGGQNGPLSYSDLAAAGHADTVIQEMVDSALINIQQQSRGFSVNNEAAAEMMKNWPQFQDADGNFDVQAFNTWVEKNNERGMNWNDLYEELQVQLGRQLYMNFALSSAGHITDAEVQKQLDRKKETLKIRYTKVAPPIYLTEEDIQKHYNDNITRYSNPERRVAQFLVSPLATARPSKADEIFQKLEEGQDFASLADEYGDQQIKNGGDLGWQYPLPDEEPHRLALFNLAVGEVSEMVKAPQGYFIYMVEEERNNEETGQREVKARQIFLLTPDMSNDERQAQNNKMSEIVSFANEKSIEEAAETFQLPVMVSGAFDNTTTEIENVPRTDTVEFRSSLQSATPEGNYVLVIGRENNYCARVSEIIPGEAKPLEEVRAQVEMDAKRAKTLEEDYRNRAKAWAYKIAREIENLDEIKDIYPNAEMEIKESQPFGIEDNLFGQGIQLLANEVFDVLDGKDIGVAAGPIRNFIMEYYFVELIERGAVEEVAEEEPTDMLPEGELEAEPLSPEEERENLKNSLLSQTANDFLNDYRIHLREKFLPNTPHEMDDDALAEILGLNNLTEDAADEVPLDAPVAPTE